MSQYKDSITGEVLIDIHTQNGKVLNLADNACGYKCPIELKSDYVKFSDNSICMDNNTSNTSGINIPILDNTDTNIFTISLWFLCHTYTEVNGPNTFQGILFGDNKSICIYPRFGANITAVIIDSTSRDIAQYLRNRSLSRKVWYHYALTCDGTNYKVYENGTQIVSFSYTKEFKFSYLNIWKTDIQNSNNVRLISYYDDIVLIKNQVLWESNFTVPNDYLLKRSLSSSKPRSKNFIYPSPINPGDYFDKVILY